MQAKALEQLRNGQSLTGKDGAFAPLLKQFIETALEAEMSSHIDDIGRISGNKRNRKKLKTLKMSSGENEGANFWLSVLTDLKARGVQDILIACINHLTGFSEAIASVFSEVEIQSCILHQVRNSLKYASGF